MNASHENFLSSLSKSFILFFFLLFASASSLSLSLSLRRMVSFHFSVCRSSPCKLLQNNFHRHTQSTINLTVAWSRANSLLLFRCLHFIMKFTFVSFFSCESEREREKQKKMINVFACATSTCLWQTLPPLFSHSFDVCVCVCVCWLLCLLRCILVSDDCASLAKCFWFCSIVNSPSAGCLKLSRVSVGEYEEKNANCRKSAFV